MDIYFEQTHNPNILKFVWEEDLVNGTHELDRKSDLSDFPVAKALFAFPFVNRLFIASDFLAIQKLDNVEWEAVAEGLKEIVKQHANNSTIAIQKPKQEAITLYAEMTPNPASMKFVANQLLVEEVVEVKSKDDATHVPLAAHLFNLPFVKEVFISENYISVQKNETVEWNDVAMEVRQYLLEYLKKGGEIVRENYYSKNSSNESLEQVPELLFTETEQKIKAILDEYIQPAVAGDGGQIDLIAFDEEQKTAKMLLRGSCSGCPSSTITLKNGIKTMLDNMLPGMVEEVQAVNG